MNADDQYLDDKTLTFGFTVAARYQKSSDYFRGVLRNPNLGYTSAHSILRAFAHFDDSTIQVWDPATGKSLYSASTASFARGHKITALLFIKCHDVSQTPISSSRYTWQQQKISSCWCSD